MERYHPEEFARAQSNLPSWREKWNNYRLALSSVFTKMVQDEKIQLVGL